MRQYGDEFSYPDWRRRRLARVRTRTLRRRGGRGLRLKRLRVKKLVEVVKRAPVGGKMPELEEMPVFTVGVGCPGVLGSIGYVGLDGLAASQFAQLGATFPPPGGVTFWLFKGNTFYQFRTLSNGVTQSRFCSSTLSLSDAQKSIKQLQQATPAQLKQWGLV